MPCSFDDKVIIEKAEFKKFTAGGDIFRVGIICDTQLPPNEKKLEENDLYVRHLRTALEELKITAEDIPLPAVRHYGAGDKYISTEYSPAIGGI